jgi:putative nucleotidyltransferase with HDIG domain
MLETAPELAIQMERKGYSRYRAFPLSARGKSLGVLEVFDTDETTARSRGLAAIASTLGAAAAFTSMIDEAMRSTKNLSAAYDATLEAWVHMLELRDQETEGHSRRVTDMTVELAGSLSVPPELIDDYRRGALLHDIGKMGVPDSILLKPGRLTAEERETMSQHPTHAYNVIKAIPFLADSIDIPYCHHERWDGTGYPRGLAGRGIPLAARLFAVVDVWDALRSDRPYRKALGAEESAALIAAGAGNQFDPDIVATFLDLRRAEIVG